MRLELLYNFSTPLHLLFGLRFEWNLAKKGWVSTGSSLAMFSGRWQKFFRIPKAAMHKALFFSKIVRTVTCPLVADKGALTGLPAKEKKQKMSECYLSSSWLSKCPAALYPSLSLLKIACYTMLFYLKILQCSSNLGRAWKLSQAWNSWE